MLLQTNSYVVPKEKRSEHARLMKRFRQALSRLGCDDFEVYEQVGPNWTGGQTNGRYVQIMRFHDLKHQHAVQAAERSDPAAQALIAEFCELVNFTYQQQQGLFAVGFYNSVLQPPPGRVGPPLQQEAPTQAASDPPPAAEPQADPDVVDAQIVAESTTAQTTPGDTPAAQAATDPAPPAAEVDEVDFGEEGPSDEEAA